MADETTTSTNRWARRKARTRQRLLAAGETLFRDRGFDATTVEEVAEAADVAKGTFFNYFESKETLLGALLVERTQAIVEDPPDGDLSPPDRIRALFDRLRQELEPYVHLFPRMFAYAVAHPQASHPASERPALWQALAAVVRDGQRDGTFRADLDPQVAGVLLSTYFFRTSILECQEEEGRDFCWTGRLEAGLEILYRGMLAPEQEGS
jgi:TetR/AcrR family transcriptional regulator, cholesterol catabolism regulator